MPPPGWPSLVSGPVLASLPRIGSANQARSPDSRMEAGGVGEKWHTLLLEEQTGPWVGIPVCFP